MADAKTNRLVELWKKLHIASRVLEPQLEEVRGDIRALIVASGADHIVTKFGTLALQRQTRTDWESLARALISADVIEANVEAYRKLGEPYVSAPREWGVEAKAKASKVA